MKPAALKTALDPMAAALFFIPPPRHRFKLSLALAVLLLLGFSACQNPNNPSDETGSISGSAFYQNETNHGGIAITLEKTDGLRSSTAIRSAQAGRALLNESGDTYGAVTAANGSYQFDEMPTGTYTIYASSPASKERAVTTNVTVSSGRAVTATDLQLTPVGNISGTITLDETPTGNRGFLVFVASTSYMAVTGDSGTYLISDVPVGTGYQLIIMKGNYTTLLETVAVSAGDTTAVTSKNVPSADLYNVGLVWKASLTEAPASPVTNWAYYNTTDKKSYIYNGSAWDVFSQDGTNGIDGTNGAKGETGVPGANGIGITWKGNLAKAPDSPQTNWAYYNTADKKSYIYTGGDWAILSQDGVQGPEDPEIPKVLTGSITISPANSATVNSLLTATYSGGSENVSYLWYRNGSSTGATVPTYVPAESGAYTVVVSVTGYLNKTSNQVTVISPPALSGSITISPTSGATVGSLLTATYSGSETVSYQWFRETGGYTTIIVDAADAIYTPTEPGKYYVSVSSDLGYQSKNSNPVTITDKS